MFFDVAQPFSIIPVPYWNNHPVPVWKKDLWNGDTAELVGNLYQCPLRIKFPDEETPWTLPLDPIISVNGGNSIVRTNVLKQDHDSYARRGTIKEVWSQDDYEVNIAGIFISQDGYFPMEEIMRLRNYCEEREILEVECDLLEAFGITRIAIESFSFPHTAGAENQQFSIKAYSDDDFSLLIEQ